MSVQKVLRCADAGYDCSFVARSQSEDELMAQVTTHAREVHNMNEIDDETRAKIKSLIHDEEAVM